MNQSTTFSWHSNHENFEFENWALRITRRCTIKCLRLWSHTTKYLHFSKFSLNPFSSFYFIHHFAERKANATKMKAKSLKEKQLRTGMQFFTFGSIKNANICVKFQQQNWGQRKLQHAHTTTEIYLHTHTPTVATFAQFKKRKKKRKKHKCERQR